MTIAGFIYRIFVLLVLFAGGFLLLRYGMAMDEKTSRIVAFVGMPVLTLVVWLASYRGKRFS